MTRTKPLAALLAAAVLFTLPAALAAQDEAGTPIEGEVELGAWDASVDGSDRLASEYETTEGGPDLRLFVKSLGDGGSLTLESEVLDADDFDLGLDFDLRRLVRSRTTYTGVPHLLLHDDLDNLAAATPHGRVVRHTDLDPDGEYRIDYTLLEHRTDFQLPGAPGLTFGFGYRRQAREGERQLLSVSHCDACHVTAQARPIDETTEDASLHALWAWTGALGGGEIRGSYLHRELSQSPDSVLVPVDDALHPEQRLPLFDNRIQYSDGLFPANLLPDVTKDRAKLGATFGRLAGFTVDTGAVWSRTENDFTDLESSYEGLVATAARRFGEAWTLAWRGRFYTLDTDDVFVDAAEPLGIAGPQAGRTYRQIYGFDPDFQRLSALNRDVIESELDLARRFGRRAGTVKLTWDFEQVDREHYEVAEDGGTKTTTHVFGLSWRGRPRDGVRLQADYEHAEVDDPFTLVNGQYSTLVSSFAASPFAPTAAQYYEFQNARVAESTASPESWDEVKLRGSYSFGPNVLSASYTWWDGSNEAGDLTDWSRTRQAATFTFAFVPAPDWQGYVTYAHHEAEIDFPTSIPIFDG